MNYNLICVIEQVRDKGTSKKMERKNDTCAEAKGVSSLDSPKTSLKETGQ
jgi:hypothetical protein